MHIKQRIKVTRYCSLTSLLLVALLFAHSWEKKQVLGIVLCMGGFSMSHFLTTYSVILITEGGNQKRIFWLFMGKLFFVIGVVFGSVHLMENLILIPLSLYLGQLMILAFSLR